MIRVVYSKRALADLERLVDFLIDAGADDPEAAVHVIVNAIRVLRRHPYVGRRLRGALRELVIAWGRAGYIAVYRVTREGVEVLSVRHQREAGTLV